MKIIATSSRPDQTVTVEVDQYVDDVEGAKAAADAIVAYWDRLDAAAPDTDEA